MSESVIQSHIEACCRHPNAGRLLAVLDRVIADSATHARFVNTLSRLEYVGVRKMLKVRRAERLDIDGLQHLLDEAVHALRLKKAAVALAATTTGADVATFSPQDTLVGDAAEDYFQELDRFAEDVLADVGDRVRSEANYLLTSAAIEVRAQMFYPTYEQRLRAHSAPFSVASITKDEDRHLAEMTQALEQHLPDWKTRLAPVLREEERLFARFLDAIEIDLDARARTTASADGDGIDRTSVAPPSA